MVVVGWENPWKGIRISWGIILKLFYWWRRTIIILRRFRVDSTLMRSTNKRSYQEVLPPGVCINKSTNILNRFYQSFNAVSDKESMHNTAFQWWCKKWKKLEITKEFLLRFLLISKAFDCIPLSLQIAKLNAFGFDKKSLSFISITENKKLR